MLVLAHPPPEGWAVNNPESTPSLQFPLPIQATLVVVPASLLEQWKEEMQRHVSRGKLKVLHYEGVAKATKTKQTAGDPSGGFEGYDIILTSYEV